MTSTRSPPTSIYVLWYAYLHTDTGTQTDGPPPSTNVKLELYLKPFFNVLRCSLAWFTNTSLWGTDTDPLCGRARGCIHQSPFRSKWPHSCLVCFYHLCGLQLVVGSDMAMQTPLAESFSGGDIHYLWKIETKQCLFVLCLFLELSLFKIDSFFEWVSWI